MSKLEIYIKGSNGKSTSNATNTYNVNAMPTTAQQASERMNVKNDIASNNELGVQGMAVASMVASRSLNYTTSNIGKWTGNSRNQEIVNTIQQGIGIGAAAYINPYLALAMVAINVGTTAIDASWTNWQEGIKSNVRKLRAGYTPDDKIIGGRK